MPTPTKGARLGGSPAHERLILANLATSLFEHGRITTTETKAKRLRPFAERLITFAKRGDLHARRRVMTVIRDKGVVHVLFTEIGPRYANRNGGYTRITKIGPRKGDNAPMAVIELCEPLAENVVAEAAAAAKRAAKEKAVADAAAAAAVAAAAVTAEASAEAAESSADIEEVGDVSDGAAAAEDAAEPDTDANAEPEVEDAATADASDEAAPDDTEADKA